jgi:endo-1,4-beta-xylanase
MAGARRRVLIGSAGERDTLANDADYAKLIGADNHLFTPEWELNWNVLQPTRGVFDFTRGDALVDFCEKCQLQLANGGALAWYQLYPEWLNGIGEGAEARRVLRDYITTVVSHYRTHAYSWDVVNEAIFTEDGRTDGLRNNVWVQKVGADYIAQAFEAARAADPSAVLVLNEYGFYYEHAYHQIRRDALLALLRDLVHRDVPVDALGIQGHLEPNGPWGALASGPFGEFLTKVTELGLKLMVTELDVADAHLSADVVTRDREVADAGREFLSLVLQQPNVAALITWGSSDKYSWLSWANPRPDGQPVRPLQYDDTLKAKPLWSAIVETIG